MRLGVGKNMVASIKFWLKAIGLLKDTGLEQIADHLFADDLFTPPTPGRGEWGRFGRDVVANSTNRKKQPVWTASSF